MWIIGILFTMIEKLFIFIQDIINHEEYSESYEYIPNNVIWIKIYEQEEGGKLHLKKDSNFIATSCL